MLAFVLVLGCGPDAASVTAESSSTSSDETSGASTSSTSGASLSETADATSSSGSGESSSSSSTGCVGDGTAGEGTSCDYVLQDCPAGSKCVVLDDEETPIRDTVCVPTDCDGKPAGEACTRDEATGVDDCAPSAFCATPFPSDGNGRCAAFCTGEPNDFACDDPANACIGSSSDGEYACFPICDPLAGDCPAGQACLAAYPGPEHTFVCYPAAESQTATTGEACYGAPEGCPAGSSCYQCAPGHTCAQPLDYGPGCDPAEFGCCTEYCELGGAPCSNPLHVCEPLFTGDAGDNADVGLCGLPDDFDWCDGSVDDPPPGLCEPADADPNFPWCSSFDDSACPGDAVHLGGQQCWCVDPCESVDECPTPESASAVPSCEPEVGCTLLCEDDSDCPDHMDCFFSDGALRCFWVPDP